MKSREEEFYEIAASELVEGNYKVGLWNKSFSMALGDDAKSHALYMKFRVEEMEAEALELEDSNSTNAGDEVPSDYKTHGEKSHQVNVIAKTADPKYVTSESSSNTSYNDLKLTHKGFKYYIGYFISILGYVLAIPHILLPGLFLINFIWSEFGVIFGVIAFFLFPLTALFGPFLLGLYTNDYKIIIESFIWIFFVSIIIGIGHWLRKPFKVKEKSTNLAQPKNEIEENGICDRYKLENKAILNIIKPLKNIKFQDADIYSIIEFDAPPSSLQYPIEVSRVSSVSNMLEFRIIDLIKRGYLKGVNYNGEWYIDIFKVNNQENADHRTFHNLTNSTRSKNVIEENAGIETDTSTPPPLPSQSCAEPPTLPEDSSPSKKTINSIGNTRTNDIVFHLKAILIIILSVVCVSAIFFFTFLIFQSPSISTPYSAAIPQQVDSTAQKDLPSKSESFVLRIDTELTIRKAPSIDSETVKTIPATVYVIQITKNYTDLKGLEWSLITVGSYNGWVPSNLLSKITKYQK